MFDGALVRHTDVVRDDGRCREPPPPDCLIGRLAIPLRRYLACWVISSRARLAMDQAASGPVRAECSGNVELSVDNGKHGARGRSATGRGQRSRSWSGCARGDSVAVGGAAADAAVMPPPREELQQILTGLTHRPSHFPLVGTAFTAGVLVVGAVVRPPPLPPPAACAPCTAPLLVDSILDPPSLSAGWRGRAGRAPGSGLARLDCG